MEHVVHPVASRMGRQETWCRLVTPFDTT